MRPETGAMKFGDDWSGIFIRGDNAIYYAAMLRDLLALTTSELGLLALQLKGLVDVLQSCNEAGQPSDAPVQKLKALDECLPNPP